MKKMMKYAMLLLAACSLTFAANAQDIVTTVVGGGPNGIPGVNANLYNPYDTAVDSAGNVYVAAQSQHIVFKISTAGVVTIVAGNGTAGYNGDGIPGVNAELYNPRGVAVDTASPANVYIADFNNCLVRKVSGSTGVITTIAGLVTVPTSGAPYSSCGYTGNGGAANAAEIYGPYAIAINPSNNDLYIAEYYNGVVRKVAGGKATGTISLVAGTGGTASGSNCGGSAPYGDGSGATAAYLCNPTGVSLDTASPVNVYITDYSRCAVREVVGSSGNIYRLAGSYTLGCGFTDNVTATSGQLNQPYQTHISISGSTTTVQVADYANARVRQFTLTYSGGVPSPGTITTIAGKGQGGFCNDNGPALNACMNPVGIAYDSSGNYYLGDYGADRVRKVTKSTGNISTIDGWGPNGGTQVQYSDPVGLSGDGGTPSLYYPYAVYADPKSSKVYVGGYYGQAVYVWDSSSNEISDKAGSGVAGFAGDGGAANTAVVDLNYPLGIGKDSSGNVYIADQNNCAIREVNASTGVITTVVGGSPGALKGCGFSGDGGTAVNAQLDDPQDVKFDSSNNMYITDYYNCAVRRVDHSTQIITTIVGGPVVGCGYSGDGGVATAAQIRQPEGLAIDGENNLYIADRNNYRIRKITAQTGIITTIAGDGAAGYTGDGPAIGNELNVPEGVAADINGNVFIADTNNQIVRWVTPTGAMITFGGTAPGGTIPSAGFSGDGGNALKAQFSSPTGISVDSSGNYYIADYYNFRIRKISAFAGFGLSTSNIQFNTQAVNSTSNFQVVTVSAVGSITISSISAPTGFSEVDDCVGQSLTAGQTCEIDVYFSPTSAANYNGTLKVTGNSHFAANPTNVTLSGTGGGLKLSASENFYTQLSNSTTSKTVTLKNSGASVNISKIYWTNTTHFAVTGGTCPISGGTLGSGASCTIITQFKPLTAGGFKSTLVISSNDPASPLLTQGLGNGTEVEVSATSINFGTITHGTNTTSNLTITNVGTVAFTLSPAVTGTGFSLPSTGDTCGSSLAGGASCVLPVEFAPTAAGSYSGSLKITTNGGSNPTVTLSGTAN